MGVCSVVGAALAADGGQGVVGAGLVRPLVLGGCLVLQSLGLGLLDLVGDLQELGSHTDQHNSVM